MKAKLMVQSFLDMPVKPISNEQTVASLCQLPLKKCAFLFSNPGKDQTALHYVQDIAKDYINDYMFYHVDLSCNEQFKQ